MTVTIKNPVTIVKQGGGGGTARPTTWAEFKNMTAAEQQACYGIGDRAGLACPYGSGDLLWEIGGWGTTRVENDNTDYPCVILVARLLPDQTVQFDAPETPTAATEETAQEGIFYFGFDGTNYTALNLSTGDTIPYSDYTAVYKTDVTNNVTYYGQLRQFGYNDYYLSALRQWLNSDATAGNWWNASHVGDVAPSQASSTAGFMNGLPADFKAILSRTEVKTAGNRATVPTATVKTSYDYFFCPSMYEVYGASTPVEGDRISYFAVNGSAKSGLRARGRIDGGNTASAWLRSAIQGSANNANYVISDGAAASNAASVAFRAFVACKIILKS
ncbi:hypothetical protein IJH89_01270 [Candidatus Saccharibacteria bacterium]|nr:hypothetical protein [Candidatus Saccharibacteria bacterium]